MAGRDHGGRIGSAGAAAAAFEWQAGHQNGRKNERTAYQFAPLAPVT